ncbi:MAG: BatD family protein, partial [Bacteroidaceae bacterium]
ADITITARSQSSAQVGETVRLQYVVNHVDIPEEPRLPSVIDGFEVLYGPAVSVSRSIQIINNKTTQNSQTTYTFTLKAEKEGTYTLPSITLTINNKRYTSNRPKISITKAAAGKNNRQSRQSSPHNSTTQTNRPSAGYTPTINSSDLYITATTDKHVVYEQQPIVLSYNVYTNLMLEQLQGKMPDLKGFVAKEIDLPRDKQLSVVRHNGRLIQTTLWSQYVMFPQQSGRLTIPSIPFEGIFAFPNHIVDPIDAYFFGTSSVVKVNHTVKSPSVDITVKPLPQAPEGFSGAVGKNFKVSAVLTTKQPCAGEPLNIRLIISGVGNIDLISPPQISFPSDFETLSPTNTADTRLTLLGQEGQLTIDYSAIPNHKGTFTIPAIKFVYFNTNDETYHTLLTDTITVTINRETTNVGKDGKKDICDIHRGAIKDSEQTDFYGSPLFYIFNIFLILLWVLVGRMVRNKTLSKILAKLLTVKHTKKLPSQPQSQEEAPAYYAEILNILKETISRKTKTPLSMLTDEYIHQLFSNNKTEPHVEENYFNLVEECRMGAYGTSDFNLSHINEVHDKAQSLLKELTKKLSPAKSFGKAVKTMLFVTLCLLSAFHANANTKDTADSLYQSHAYRQAIGVYSQLLDKHPNNPMLLYNIANCHYRLNDVSRAILYYERATKQDPSDKDIRLNLSLAIVKAKNKYTAGEELKPVSIFRTISGLCSVDGWAILSVVGFAFVVLFAIALKTTKQKKLRNIFRIVLVLSVATIVFSHVFAAYRYNELYKRNEAIVIIATPLMTTPDTTLATKRETIPSSTKVTVSDTTLGRWSEIILPDGKKGWVSSDDIEKI